MATPNSVRIFHKTFRLNESQVFMKSINSRCTASLYTHLFPSRIWWTQKKRSAADLQLPFSPHSRCTTDAFAYAVNLDTWIFCSILYPSHNSNI